MALIQDRPKTARERRFLDTLFAPFRGRAVAPSRTEGVGGVAAFGGFVEENEKNARLRGRERYITFSNMLANVSIVAAGTRFFLNLTAKAGWKVEPADNSARARQLAELTEEILHDMTTPWHRVVRRAAMYRFHGFSVQEWTARRRPDGALGFADVEPRPQVTIERWDLDASGTVHGVVQNSPQDSSEIYLPRRKLLYMVDDTLSDSPEGLGLFRHIVSATDRLCRFELLESYGYETDLRGIPIARGPLALLNDAVEKGLLKKEDADAAVNSLKTFVEKHVKNPELGLLLDSIPYRADDEAATPSATPQWNVELLRGDGTGTVNDAVGNAITRLNQEIARVLGVEGLLLGGQQVGSLALSRDKSHNFALIVDSTLTELRETVAADLVDVLFELNGWEPELTPELKTEATRYRDVTEITAALRDMATAGAILAPDDPAISEVRELMGLSRPPEVLDGALMPGVGPDPDPEPELELEPEPEPEPTDEGEELATSEEEEEGDEE